MKKQAAGPMVLFNFEQHVVKSIKIGKKQAKLELLSLLDAFPN